MASKRERLHQLDLIRFLAALYVVFYHYGFRGFNGDNMSVLQFEEIEFFSKYGYLGVDLFFIISGFVILMTALNSNIVSFFISRVSRLYPAYWICVSVTALIVLLWGGERYSVTPFVYFTNLTMFNGFFGIEYVDGVYWSLLVELKFYIIIGCILLFRKMKYLKYVIYAWLLISTYYLIASQFQWDRVLSIINFFLIPRWCSYFVAGMLFYLIRKDGNIKARIIPLLYCLLLSLSYAFLKVDILNDKFGGVFAKEVVFVLVLFFYVIFYLFSTKRLQFINKPLFLKLGMLTYPLYLLHQNIGYIIFNNLSDYNPYLLLILVMGLMIYLSYLVSAKLEKPWGKYMRQKLQQSAILNRSKSILKIDRVKN